MPAPTSRVVLNHIRDRAADDPRLAYLEWSSAPERRSDDVAGWLEANPAVGHMAGVFGFLEDSYRSYRLSGEMGIFETEHLCRWVHTVLPPIIRSETWEELRGDVAPRVAPRLACLSTPTDSARPQCSPGNRLTGASLSVLCRCDRRTDLRAGISGPTSRTWRRVQGGPVRL